MPLLLRPPQRGGYFSILDVFQQALALDIVPPVLLSVLSFICLRNTGLETLKERVVIVVFRYVGKDFVRKVSEGSMFDLIGRQPRSHELCRGSFGI